MARVIIKKSEMVSDDVCFKWEIKNFSLEKLMNGGCQVVKSPSFKCFNMEFHLEMSDRSKTGFNLDLQLIHGNSDDPLWLTECNIGFYIDSKWYGENFPAPDRFSKISYSISVDALKKDCVENKVLNAGCIFIATTLKHTLETHSGTQTAASEPRKSIQQGLLTLAESIGSITDDFKFSDVTLKVGEETLQAHKAILASRSKVFDGMFVSGTKESQEDVVQLVEMKSSTAKEMMQYIYTGKIEELSIDRALDLYSAADSYDLQELREWCKDFIMEHIAVDDVCHVAVLGDLHRDEELAKAARRVFKQESKTILMSRTWKDFAKNYPSVYMDLVESTLNES